MDPTERDARAQTIFRAGNEALRRAAGPPDGAVPFLCECGDEQCFERISLTPAEYEEVRAHPRRFAVAPGHEGSDRAIALNDGYAVVEKDAAAGEIAVETDPRRRHDASGAPGEERGSLP